MNLKYTCKLRPTLNNIKYTLYEIIFKSFYKSTRFLKFNS